MPITLAGANHYAITVYDLDESIAWYERVLGYRLAQRNDIPHLGIDTAHMDAPDGSIMLEIFAPKQGLNPLPEARKDPDDDMFTVGNKHFCLTVPDADQTVQELEALGIEILRDIQPWGHHALYIADNSGNLIELFEGDMR
jgi:catechol 2,3-dioxygenase-like lactoylglutathione lyase family enzyme